MTRKRRGSVVCGGFGRAWPCVYRLRARMRGLVGLVGGRREVVEARRFGKFERLEDAPVAVRELGALGDGALVGRERDEVHAVKLVAQVAPGVAGGGLGDAQQQQREPAELD